MHSTRCMWLPYRMVKPVDASHILFLTRLEFLEMERCVSTMEKRGRRVVGVHGSYVAHGPAMPITPTRLCVRVRMEVGEGRMPTGEALNSAKKVSYDPGR